MSTSSKIRVARWEPGAVLRVTGEDAATFLQGQFTNELRGLKAGGSSYGLWLNQKGKVMADSFVTPGMAAGEFFAVSYFSAAAVIKQRLEDYIIADDVVLEDLTGEWTGISVLGQGATAWLREREGRAGIDFAGRRAKGESVEWIFPRQDEAAASALVAGELTIDGVELARERIEAGIPAVPADIGPGDLPGEGGLENDAISYTKGCYLGQEVMARLKSMGQVRRRLMRVAGPGALPSLPAPLWQGGRQVGELRSGVRTENGFVGHAMLSLINFRREHPLALAVDGVQEIRWAGEATT